MPRRKPAGRNGRPARLTTDIAFRLGASLGHGHSVVDSSRAAGVSSATLYRWLALGRAGDPRYAMLAVAVAKSAADRERARSLFGSRRRRRRRLRSPELF